jgi:hypothetical protein
VIDASGRGKPAPTLLVAFISQISKSIPLPT